MATEATVRQGPGALEESELRERIRGRQWYHTLELAPGLETPGWFDLRPLAPRILPPSLEGQRCLDIGTFDGFWAFEMERRGARDVLGIDILDPYRWDWPANSDEATISALAERKREGVGFELARRAFNSSVERRELSVYDLDRERHGGYDLVYVGSLLLHLRDPVGALMRVRSICDGTLIVCDAIDLGKTRRFARQPVATLDAVGRPWWWKPNLAGLVRMVEAAGFELAEPPARIRMPLGAGHDQRRFHPLWLLSAAAREEMMTTWRGEPHGVVKATPALSAP
jgi:tRNA (mo5U34)-methyltransferase